MAPVVSVVLVGVLPPGGRLGGKLLTSPFRLHNPVSLLLIPVGDLPLCSSFVPSYAAELELAEVGASAPRLSAVVC